ncbi:MAG: hypothetical protein PHV30_08700 [Candidatus Margulisbacteria bacterium]|nr:hypothetical protein [Candidatus Margulisiibacteriota bacterium]
MAIRRLRLTLKPKLKITRRYIEKLGRFSASYSDVLNKYSGSYGATELNEQLLVYEKEKSLDTQLLEQISRLYVPAQDKEILKFMVDLLDEKGFFSDWADVKEKVLRKYKLSTYKLQQLLDIFQALEPEGVGARSVSEYLIIQIKQHHLEDEDFKGLLIKILAHEDLIVNAQFGALAELLGVSRQEVEKGLLFIRQNLVHQLPGEIYKRDKNQFIVPSAEIKIGKDNKLEVVMMENYDYIADLYIQRDMNERKKLLKQLLELFCEYQDIGMFKSMSFLRPLTQKEIADRLGLSYSFVSRLVNRKYVLINSKNILLKNLLQNRIKNSQLTGYFLKNILQDPNIRGKSDAQVKELLQAYNIKISRRLVNYYKHKIKT